MSEFYSKIRKVLNLQTIQKLIIFLFFLGILVWGNLVLLPNLFSGKFTSGYHGSLINREAVQFSLYDELHSKIELLDFKGNYIFLFFGYPGCAGICPPALSKLQDVKRLVHRNDVKIVFINLDVNSERNHRKIENESSDFLYLHSEDSKTIQNLLKAYFGYADFSYLYNGNQEYPIIQHSGFFYLINPKGNLQLLYTDSKTGAKEIVDDLQKIILEENG